MDKIQLSDLLSEIEESINQADYLSMYTEELITEAENAVKERGATMGISAYTQNGYRVNMNMQIMGKLLNDLKEKIRETKEELENN